MAWKLLWKFDDWLAFVSIIAMLVMFTITISGAIPRLSQISFETVPYNISQAFGPQRSCLLVDVPPSFSKCVMLAFDLDTSFSCSGVGLYCPKYDTSSFRACTAPYPLAKFGPNVGFRFGRAAIPDGDDQLTFSYSYFTPSIINSACYSSVTGGDCYFVNAGSFTSFGFVDKWNVAVNGLGLRPWFFRFQVLFYCSNCSNATTGSWGVDQTYYAPLPFPTMPPSLSQDLGNASYPFDNFNRFGLGLQGLYTELATSFLSQPLSSENNYEFYLGQLQQLEQILVGLPSNVPLGTNGCQSLGPFCGSNYTNQLSSLLSTCVQESSLMMSCQSVTQEPQFDYVVRLFGYTFFICLTAQIVQLAVHAIYGKQENKPEDKSDDKLVASLKPNRSAQHTVEL